MSDPRIDDAVKLMTGFARRTGLTGERPSRRYLWTDAFAVCNFLGLTRASADQAWTDLALNLVHQVHHTLGRHRDDDRRQGWISGLSEADGEQHPTQGGLRIGKALPERAPHEPVDERQEWDRDGQYFHYLTKWMHALDQLARATHHGRFNTWARELAHRAYEAFTYQPTPGWELRRMYWKMSIDLTRAQVNSMGQHDPLDGYITQLQLRATAIALAQSDETPDLAHETRQYAAMIQRGDWATADPLGIGGLLVDACRLQQLVHQGVAPVPQLIDRLLGASLAGLRAYAQSGELQQAARYRLAFRELGLVIGLHAVDFMLQSAEQNAQASYIEPLLRKQLSAFAPYMPLRAQIETFWRDAEHQGAETWVEHQDINEVMLATSLSPEGFLQLASE